MRRKITWFAIDPMFTTDQNPNVWRTQRSTIHSSNSSRTGTLPKHDERSECIQFLYRIEKKFFKYYHPAAYANFLYALIKRFYNEDLPFKRKIKSIIRNRIGNIVCISKNPKTDDAFGKFDPRKFLLQLNREGFKSIFLDELVEFKHRINVQQKNRTKLGLRRSTEQKHNLVS